MGLLPLEFTECLQDSPYFRDSLISHEKELERTSNNMKELIKEVKNLLSAARSKLKYYNIKIYEFRCKISFRKIKTFLYINVFIPDIVYFSALSSAQRRLSNTLLNFKFECIGNQQTDDEIIIAG